MPASSGLNLAILVSNPPLDLSLGLAGAEVDARRASFLLTEPLKGTLGSSVNKTKHTLILVVPERDPSFNKMTGQLFVSIGNFPYAAAAIARFTQQANVIIKESDSLTLELGGSKILGEEAIVHALANAGGLSDDSTKVSQPLLG